MTEITPTPTPVKKQRKPRSNRKLDANRVFIASGGHCFVKETIKNNITGEVVECLKPLPKLSCPKDISLTFNDPRGFKILSFLGINMTTIEGPVYNGKDTSFNGLPIRKINQRGSGRPVGSRRSKAGSEKVAPEVPGQSLQEKFEVEKALSAPVEALPKITTPIAEIQGSKTAPNPFRPEPKPIAELSFETSTVEEKPVAKPAPRLEFEFD